MNLSTTKQVLAGCLMLGSFNLFAQLDQKDVTDYNISGDLNNPILTALPFLTIAPDSRGGGMGEVGAATSPDVWSMHWNPSKYAFVNKEMGAGISYVPWLRNLGVKDINLAYASGYYRLDKTQTLAGGLRFFSMGTIQFRDNNGAPMGTFDPKEFTFDLAYARKLSEKLSLSIAGRYVNSNLTNGYSSNGSEVKPARTVAADVSGFYTDKTKVQEYPVRYSVGFNASNIGAKVGYSSTGEKNFIPTNLRIGAGVDVDIDAFNTFGLYADVNKLLVPTPPAQLKDSTSGEYVIIDGKDDDVSVVTGIFQSFNDAPGGFKEELHELQYSVGMEYWYDKQFALRGGYYTEHETKGNRKFFQLGLGLKMNVFGLDFSYLVPAKGMNSPLAKTIRFSLTFDFEGLQTENKEKSL